MRHIAARQNDQKLGFAVFLKGDELAIYERCQARNHGVLCKVMQVSTGAFYTWAKRSEDTDKKILQKQLEAKVIELFEEKRTFMVLAVYRKPL
jgi:hypothetical protein